MELNIYTIFNRVDGSSDQLVLARSDARVSTDFVNSVTSRNKELGAKNYPLINLNDYELRKIGVFEDTNSVITPLTPVVIPFDLTV